MDANAGSSVRTRGCGGMAGSMFSCNCNCNLVTANPARRSASGTLPRRIRHTAPRRDAVTLGHATSHDLSRRSQPSPNWPITSSRARTPRQTHSHTNTNPSLSALSVLRRLVVHLQLLRWSGVPCRGLPVPPSARTHTHSHFMHMPTSSLHLLIDYCVAAVLNTHLSTLSDALAAFLVERKDGSSRSAIMSRRLRPADNA